MMNRRKFLADAAAVAATGAFARTAAAAHLKTKSSDSKKPNLLFIQPDQFRIFALGIWREPGFRDALKTVSDPVHTPALNQLTRESLLFTRAAATAAVCSPSRAMLMSGMYPSQNGVASNCVRGSTQGMHDNIPCITDVLSNSGYETAFVGKTHWERTLPLFDKDGNYVGTENPPGGHYVNSFDTYIPPGKGRHGNKYWFQDIDRHGHFNPYSYSSVPALVGGKKDGQLYRNHGFAPTIEADVTIGYLKNKNGQRDPNKPFSIMWDPLPPHTPYSSLANCEPDIYHKYYEDLPLKQLLNRPNVNLEEAEHYRTRKKPRSLAEVELCARVYFSLVTSIDRQVGRILQALEESGEAENTIVVFTADHGEMMASHGRFYKSVIYDEAFRIPLMIRYPNRLKPRIEDLMIGKVDMMPTLLSLMGLQDRIPRTVQGVDYSAGLLTGNFTEKPKSEAYLMVKGKGLRTDRYTYRVGSDGETELFDNVADPYQLKNLPPNSIHSADLRFLQEELGRWLKRADDPWYEARLHSQSILYPGA